MTGEQTVGRPSRRRAGVIALWCLQIATAALLTNAAIAKFTGNEEYTAAFAAFGLGGWFMHLVGVLELLGGLGLLLPRLAGLAAAMLTVMMAGAVASELTVIKGSAAPAASVLLAVILIAWFRRATISHLFRAASRR